MGHNPRMSELPPDFHDRLADLLREVTSAEVAKAVAPMEREVARLRRVLEGENGTNIFSYGVTGAIEKVIATDALHDRRLTELEKKWDRLKWSLVGAAAGGGVFGGGIVAWLNNIVAGG